MTLRELANPYNYSIQLSKPKNTWGILSIVRPSVVVATEKEQMQFPIAEVGVNPKQPLGASTNVLHISKKLDFQFFADQMFEQRAGFYTDVSLAMMGYEVPIGVESVNIKDEQMQKEGKVAFLGGFIPIVKFNGEPDWCCLRIEAVDRIDLDVEKKNCGLANSRLQTKGQAIFYFRVFHFSTAKDLQWFADGLKNAVFFTGRQGLKIQQ